MKLAIVDTLRSDPSVVMSPYLDDSTIQPVEEALEAPLKTKPQLVAPEPGLSHLPIGGL